MIIKALTILALLTYLIVLPSPSTAAEDCPTKLAVISQSPIAEEITAILMRVYKSIGCTPKLTLTPGRRGIASFNAGVVEGEIFRLPVVEKLYQRKFVRSTSPLFLFKNYLWVHPDDRVRQHNPIGYVFGAIWQEDYANTHTNIRKFHNYTEMIGAYNRGNIGGFLSALQTGKIMIREKLLMPPPLAKEHISSEPIYHYLTHDLAPFMKHLSHEIKKQDAFSSLK